MNYGFSSTGQLAQAAQVRSTWAVFVKPHGRWCNSNTASMGWGIVGLKFHGWGEEGGEDCRLIDLSTFIHVARLWTTAVRLW